MTWWRPTEHHHRCLRQTVSATNSCRDPFHGSVHQSRALYGTCGVFLGWGGGVRSQGLGCVGQPHEAGVGGPLRCYWVTMLAAGCQRFWRACVLLPETGAVHRTSDPSQEPRLSTKQQQRDEYGISVAVVAGPHPAGPLGDGDGLCARDATLSGVRGTRAGSNEYPDPFGAWRGSTLDIIPSRLIIMDGNRMLI